METGALAFWVLSWGFVLGLTAWAFGKILRGKRHFDPDGIGPEAPPEPGRAEGRGRS
jgi:hypothetical protein